MTTPTFSKLDRAILGARKAVGIDWAGEIDESQKLYARALVAELLKGMSLSTTGVAHYEAWSRGYNLALQQVKIRAGLEGRDG
jgi:hypothetical protein